MTSQTSLAEILPQPEPLIGNLGAAESLVHDVSNALEGLVSLIEQETKLVRMGALFAASDLQEEKRRLATAYVKLRFKVRDNAVAIGHLPPDTIRELARQHETFAELLRMNLAVLATAREVAEDIVRNVAKAVGKHNAPSTYNPAMRIQKNSNSSARGIALDKNL
jgi:hypothetical protein